jgi:hypothetical protein
VQQDVTDRVVVVDRPVATGADCAPTGDPADLSLSSQELGATYLGSTSLVAPEGAGGRGQTAVPVHRLTTIASASGPGHGYHPLREGQADDSSSAGRHRATALAAPAQVRRAPGSGGVPLSCTEKTQPFRVKLWDGTFVRVARHDHRDGHCDLPSTLAGDRIRGAALQGMPEPRLNTRCYWDLHWTGIFVCCCRLCRPQIEHRNEIKGARRRSRMDLRSAVKHSHSQALEG